MPGWGCVPGWGRLCRAGAGCLSRSTGSLPQSAVGAIGPHRSCGREPESRAVVALGTPWFKALAPRSSPGLRGSALSSPGSSAAGRPGRAGGSGDAEAGAPGGGHRLLLPERRVPRGPGALLALRSARPPPSLQDQQDPRPAPAGGEDSAR